MDGVGRILARCRYDLRKVDEATAPARFRALVARRLDDEMDRLIAAAFG